MSPLLEVDSLSKSFSLPQGRQLHAVNGVSLAIEEGESLGLVGESGSGKTTTGRCILRLLQPTDGIVHFDGRDVLTCQGRDLRRLRAQMRVVFQEPFESLNPRLRIGEIIGEPLLLHRPDLSRAARRRRALELMERVQLAPQLVDRRPGQLSGGQQQRVGIARAIATEPRFVVLDEPTSALDVSVRAQILELLLGLQRERGFSYLFISHDLSTVQYSCGHIAVMYLGRIVEYGQTAEVFSDPRHPYTKALLSAILAPDVDHVRAPIVLRGEVPSAIELPPGCAFAPRCPLAVAECLTQVPALRPLGASRRVACIRAEEVPALMTRDASGGTAAPRVRGAEG
jgi:peptide/nickel transport system ATP-binding protein/oligopeptide transport system ATP-binding protein